MQNALRTKDQLSDSLERIEKGEFYEKSPERTGHHYTGNGNTMEAGGGLGTSQTKVVVTSVSVE